MMDPKQVAALIRACIPDAEIKIYNPPEASDKFEVLVKSDSFAGKSRLAQHRMVQQTLHHAFLDGTIHAVSIKTECKN